MSTELAFRFLFGRYHATPWGRTVNDGLVEWPPSPWRILRALYAVSRESAELTADREVLDGALRSLARAGPPNYVLPPIRSAHTRHYMRQPKSSSDLVLDAFHALDPNDELRVHFDVELTESERRSLAAVLARLGSLGRSEAVCEARLSKGAEPEAGERTAVPLVKDDDAPADARLVDVLCWAGEGDPLADLGRSVLETRAARRRQPQGSQQVAYLLFDEEPAERPVEAVGDRPTLARFRLSGPGRPSLHHAVLVGEAARQALQSRFGFVAGGDASPTFSGRAGDERRHDQHRHAHFLVTADRASRRADHLTVWAPEGFGTEELQALTSLRHFGRRTFEGRAVRAALVALGTEDALTLPGVTAPAPGATRWRSVTPFGLVRHPKPRGGRLVDGPEDQVRRELAVRGLPQPVTVRLLAGGPWTRFRRSREFQARTESLGVHGVELELKAPIRGPLALGALSHFGLGLFAPDSNDEKSGGVH